MLKEKEAVLLQHLRQNSRKSLTEISKETKIPVSTLFDALKRLESGTIIKHVSLLNFPNLGYGLRVSFAIGTKQKNNVKKFLLHNPNVNSLYSLINGYEFLAECVFKDFKEVIDFKNALEELQATDMQEIFIVEELKREGFCLDD